LIGKEFVCGFDIIELEAMSDHRCEIDTPGFNHSHEPPHPLLAAWAEARHDPMVAKDGSEGIERNGQG